MRFSAYNEYCGRFICNYDTTVTITILKRTPKMAKTINNLTRDIKWKKIYNGEDEWIRYCPGVVISAKDRITETDKKSW